jgi:hypothetical protein
LDGRTFDALSLQITLNREGAYYTKAIRKVNEKKLDKHVVEKRKLDKGTSPVLNLLCLKTGEIFYAVRMRQISGSFEVPPDDASCLAGICVRRSPSGKNDKCDSC